MGIFRLKNIWLILLLAFIFSCEIVEVDDKTNDRNPAKVAFEIFGEEKWDTISNGGYLKLNVEIDYEYSTDGLQVEKMECFLGNIKIASSDKSKCYVCYKIENMQTGEYEFRIEAETSAPGYDKTIALSFFSVIITN